MSTEIQTGESALLPIVGQLEQPDTITKFVHIYKAIYHLKGQDADNTAKEMLAAERFNFLRQVAEKELFMVTPLSASGVFLEVISSALTFNPGANHVYLLKRGFKSGKKNAEGKDIYEDRLVYSKTVFGKIYLAQRAKSVQTITEPVMVYDCDEFSPPGSELYHKPKFPRPAGSKLVAAYCYVIAPNGFKEPIWMNMEDVERLRGYSGRNNKKYENGGWKEQPNKLYTSGPGSTIDTGFFSTKLIHKALKYKRFTEIMGANEVAGDDIDEAMLTHSTNLEPTFLPPVLKETLGGDVQAPPAPTNNDYTEATEDSEPF